MLNLYKHPTVKKFIIPENNPAIKKTQIPTHSRIIVDGGTGAGKTNMVVNYLLESPLTYEQIVVVNQGIDEPIYDSLKAKLAPLGKLTFFTIDDFPSAKELAATREHEKDEIVVIFDDLVSEMGDRKFAKKIKEYFNFGRKLHLTTFFLTQDFHSVPKPIRGQMSHLILLKLNSDRDLTEILRNFRLGITLKQLEEMYSIATEEPFGFLKIFTTGTDMNKKFTRNFTDEFRIEKVLGPDGNKQNVVLAGPWFLQNPKKRKFTFSHKKNKESESEKESSSDNSSEDEEEEDN